MTQTIFVAASSEPLRHNLCLILEKAQYQVIEASDGREALTRLKDNQDVRLLVAEMELAQFDGLQLTQQVRHLSQFTFLPILLVSSEDPMAREAEGLAAGVTGWLRPPVQAEQLLTIVDRLLI
jgi:two-component system, chemotaxis family, chemotaxis protein CheY